MFWWQLQSQDRQAAMPLQGLYNISEIKDLLFAKG